jgi:hypothetical protein
MKVGSAAVALLVAGSAVRAGMACECGTSPVSAESVAASLARNDAVFVGRVVHIGRLNMPTRAKPLTFYPAFMTVLDVESSWKGVASNRTTVFSGTGWSDCGFVFEKGERYLVLAAVSGVFVPGALNTSRCEYTRPAAEAGSVLALLGKPVATFAPESRVPPARSSSAESRSAPRSQR